MTGTWATGWATGDIVTAAEFKKTAGAIFDSTLGASAASIDVTGISATYAHLMVSLYARGDTAAAAVAVSMRFNGDTAANYDYQTLAGTAASPSAGEAFTVTAAQIAVCTANTAAANLFAACQVFIPNYSGSTNNKQYVSIDARKVGVTTGSLVLALNGGGWRSNAAINQVTIFPGAGNFVAGTRLTVHALGA